MYLLIMKDYTITYETVKLHYDQNYRTELLIQ